MEILESIEQYEQIIQKERVMLLFTADWCPDCRVIEPFLPALEVDYQEIEFYSVDRDQFGELAQELDVFGIPSFIAFSKGIEVDRFVSKNRKTRVEIEAFFNQLNW